MNRESNLSKQQGEFLESLVEAFRSCDDHQQRAYFEPYLEQVAGELRPELFRHLLQCVHSFHSQQGTQAPDFEELQQAYPDYAKEILSTVNPLETISQVDTHAAAPDQGSEPLSPESLKAIGDYQIHGKLAQGGMGMILRAFDPAFDRWLAVKVGLPNRNRSDLNDRFTEEAQLTGKLQHPGIPPVHVLGTLPDGRPYFSMKLIEGETLSDVLRSRKVGEELPRLLGIFSHICDTVAYAHSRNVIHRDLKPANIMVGAFGEVQVMDWGLAKELHARSPRPEPNSKSKEGDPPSPTSTNAPSTADMASEITLSLDSRLPEANDAQPLLTMPGDILGTPKYMAPEQARGDLAAIGTASDVFGLGAILCEILTGQPPYSGGTVMETLRQAEAGDWAEAARRLEEMNVDPPLLELTHRCLAQAPEGRFADAGELAERMHRYLEEVAERLKEADVLRAKAEVAIVEEQKRSQLVRQRTRLGLSLGLAVTLLLLVLLGSLAGYQSLRANRIAEQVRMEEQRNARRDRINAEVQEALSAANEAHDSLRAQLASVSQANRLMSDVDNWLVRVESVRALVERAKRVARADAELLNVEIRQSLNRLHDALLRDEQAVEIAKRFDDLRQLSFTPSRTNNHAWIAEQYELIFADLGIDIESLTLAAWHEFLQGTQGTRLDRVLIAALDDWSMRQAFLDNPERHLEIAQLLAAIDPDAWRDRLRHPRAASDRALIEELAGELDPTKQSPSVLRNLVFAMKGLDLDCRPTLHTALLAYPDDYYLINLLAFEVDAVEERVHCFRILTAIRPDSAISWCNLASALLELDDPTGVVSIRRALELDPEYADAYASLGVYYANNNDADNAIRTFRKAIELQPDRSIAHHNLGEQLLQQGRLEEAIQAFEQSLAITRLDPRNNEGTVPLAERRSLSFRGIGRAHIMLGQPEQAVEPLRTALELNPADKDGWGCLVDAHKELKQPQEARRSLDRMIALDSDDLWAWQQLASLVRDYGPRAGSTQDLERALERIFELDPSDKEAANNLGVIKIQQGRIEDAVRVFRAVVAQHPNHPGSLANLAMSLMQSGEVDEGLQILKKAKDLEPALAPNYWISIGVLHARRQEWAEAEVAYQKVIELRPADVQQAINLALSMANQYKFGEAVDVLEQVQRRVPAHPRLTRYLNQLQESQARAKKATIPWDDLIQLPDEEQRELLVLRGRTFLLDGNIAEALQAARHALALNLEDSQVLYDLSCLLALIAETSAVAPRASDPSMPDTTTTTPSEDDGKQIKRDAVTSLRRAFEMGLEDKQQALHDPELKSLRDEAEFQQLIRVYQLRGE